MSKAKTSPYGCWVSPITAEMVASQALSVSDVALVGGTTSWIEMRPAEGGRCAIVLRLADGPNEDVLPPPFSARTRVHEYGGAPYLIDGDSLYFSNFEDQRLYCLKRGRDPRPISPDTPTRYADCVVDPVRERIICVQEDHAGDEARNAIVGVPMDGSSDPEVLISGKDFYASPRVSPDGTYLAWLSWNHPNMPWNGTELWVGELAQHGSIRSREFVAGGRNESIFQPQWSPDGALTFVSDRTNWWNLYQLRDGRVDHILDMAADFGRPQWVFGRPTYDFASAETIICSFTQEGVWRLAALDLSTGTLQPFQLPFTEISCVRATSKRAVFIGGSPTRTQSVVELDLDTRDIAMLRRTSRVPLQEAYLSRPQQIAFPTEDGLLAHGFYYTPSSPDCRGPADARPPLLVMVHGGPTAATTGTLNLSIQYWTSRGFAVLDVNYRGSTGYGRAYRSLLEGAWGIVDVEDCANGARYLVESDEVDGNRLLIRGGSAGGYTTLRTLTSGTAFAAGASYYGVSDLEALARETHKFESHYLDTLIGPYPEQRDVYIDRSPVHNADEIACPVIFLQGEEDRVVPPPQAEVMVEAVRRKGLSAPYLLFPGEQHGFRRALTIKCALRAELSFYAKVLDLELPDPLTSEDLEEIRQATAAVSGLDL